VVSGVHEGLSARAAEKREPGRGREKGIAKGRNFIFFPNGENITVQTER